ncbi:nucleotidyltransferase family protein [Aurantiacibacter spongiae]|uniref:Nucleotidyltransferase family protein n=1 Tax=Aurantiacibacter spongiae TaxID=2488860 RepID=A0A3N5CY14_9SPHN|nr:nucleotidyltransferase family protein [Aurantiacibacter spongiae]RPF71529.1 hypothetical protein EG799_07800 [Aurantiacibacter spongiae]
MRNFPYARKALLHRITAGYGQPSADVAGGRRGHCQAWQALAHLRRMPSTSSIDAFLASALRGDDPAWPGDWLAEMAARVADRIAFHGIDYALFSRADMRPGWPKALLQGLRRGAMDRVFWEEMHVRALLRVLGGLRQASVESVLLKGTALAYGIYPDPAARGRGDTDLLVRETDVKAAREVLKSAGFVRANEPFGLYFQEMWVQARDDGQDHIVDLHWRPVDSPVLQQALCAEDCFADTCEVQGLGQGANMPDRVSLFLHGALNQAWHARFGYSMGATKVFGGERLVWACDTHLLVSAFEARDWGNLAERALAGGSAPVCIAALEWARTALGTEVPGDVFERLATAETDTPVMRYLHSESNQARFVADLRETPGVREKGRLLAGALFPPAWHLRQLYPDDADSPLAFLHMRRLSRNFTRSGRLLRR